MRPLVIQLDLGERPKVVQLRKDSLSALMDPGQCRAAILIQFLKDELFASPHENLERRTKLVHEQLQRCWMMPIGLETVHGLSPFSIGNSY